MCKSVISSMHRLRLKAMALDFNDGATKLMCVFETTEGTGTFTVKSVVSVDDGKTWGFRSQVYVPTGSGNNGGHTLSTRFDTSYVYLTPSQQELLK